VRIGGGGRGGRRQGRGEGVPPAKTIFMKSHVRKQHAARSNFLWIAHKNFMKHVNSIRRVTAAAPRRSFGRTGGGRAEMEKKKKRKGGGGGKMGARRKSIAGFPAGKKFPIQTASC